MPKFSNRSLEALDTCDSRLIILFNEVIDYYDCTVLEGFRTKEAHDEYIRRGVTRVHYEQSKHSGSPSRAIDVAVCGMRGKIDWNNSKSFYHFGGFVMGLSKGLGIDIRWGGDWDSDNNLNDQNFMDLVHFELVER